MSVPSSDSPVSTARAQVLSVVSFRTGGFDAIFTWEESSGYGYWGLWVRQLGSMIMMFPILLVPVIGLIQAIRFVRSGEGDLYDVSGWLREAKRELWAVGWAVGHGPCALRTCVGICRLSWQERVLNYSGPTRSFSTAIC